MVDFTALGIPAPILFGVSASVLRETVHGSWTRAKINMLEKGFLAAFPCKDRLDFSDRFLNCNVSPPIHAAVTFG